MNRSRPLSAPRPERVTSSEVAQLAGVSQSAVSRTFTPGASVAADTARKVRAAAQRLGYRPNRMAQSMITGKSRIIGLVVAYLDNQFYPEALEKLSRGLQEEGYHVLIFLASNGRENIDHVFEEILDYQVEGIIAASVALSGDLTRRCEAAGVPVVLFNRAEAASHFTAVTSDNIEGARKLAHHFADMGARRPAYIAGWEGASTQQDREQGFLQGLAEAGLTLFARGQGNYQQEAARLEALRLFTSSPHPDAVFVANDHMAFAVMDALRSELGLRIPEDVMVAGYDDVSIASWPAYDLTSVRQPANRMAEATIETLLAQINDKSNQRLDIKQDIKIDGPLVIRGTTRKRSD